MGCTCPRRTLKPGQLLSSNESVNITSSAVRAESVCTTGKKKKKKGHFLSGSESLRNDTLRAEGVRTPTEQLQSDTESMGSMSAWTEQTLAIPSNNAGLYCSEPSEVCLEGTGGFRGERGTSIAQS